jgi:predicted nuclease of predicted toxin-antitoxin system
MKLLFDQNISSKILKILPQEFQLSSHVKNEGLINKSDKQILDFAKQNEFIIVTQDSDFNDLNTLFGYPPKIIWIRTGNIKTKLLLEILMDYIKDLINFIDDSNYGCFEIFRIMKK